MLNGGFAELLVLGLGTIQLIGNAPEETVAITVDLFQLELHGLELDSELGHLGFVLVQVHFLALFS